MDDLQRYDSGVQRTVVTAIQAFPGKFLGDARITLPVTYLISFFNLCDSIYWHQRKKIMIETLGGRDFFYLVSAPFLLESSILLLGFARSKFNSEARRRKRRSPSFSSVDNPPLSCTKTRISKALIIGGRVDF